MDREKYKRIAKEIQFEYSSFLGPVVFHGHSMRPFLEDGDELKSKSVDWREIRIGDIITYRLEDKFPTYRVMKKYDDKLILKADNWPELFEVGKEKVLGKIIMKRRGISSLSSSNFSWIFHSTMVVWRYRKDVIMSKLRYYYRKLKASL